MGEYEVYIMFRYKGELRSVLVDMDEDGSDYVSIGFLSGRAYFTADGIEYDVPCEDIVEIHVTSC